MSKKRALGKGLSALLESADADLAKDSPIGVGSKAVGSISSIHINQIEANPFNPRTQFEEDALNELAASIGEHGIIQPLTVRKLGRDKYQLISGERRFRASQLAGVEEVPCYIRVADDQTMLEMALVENIQRVDLNAVEVALSYKRLIDECNFTQEELSKKLGKSRSNIANFLRLLNLPVPIQVGIKEGLISMGHARALLSLKTEELQLDAFKKVIADNLSVRDVEALVKGTTPKTKGGTASKSVSADFSSFQSSLSKVFGKSVKINSNNKGGGKVVIAFNSEDELENIIKQLG